MADKTDKVKEESTKHSQVLDDDVTKTSLSITGMRPGFAAVKAEFIDHNHEKKLVTDYMPEQVAEAFKAAVGNGCKRGSEGEDSQPNKKMKFKGRNKKRPMVKQRPANERLCPEVIRGDPCSWGEKCKYNHDFTEYLATKPPDLGDRCYIYDTFGKCNFSLTCRFAKCHMTEDGKNMVNEELVNQLKGKPTVLNVLDKDLQRTLWKKKYNFDKANECWKKVEAEFHRTKQAQQKEEMRLESHIDEAVCKDVKVENVNAVIDLPVKTESIKEAESNVQSSEKQNCESPETSKVSSAVNVMAITEGTGTVTCDTQATAAADADKMKMQRDPVALGDDLIRLRPQEKKKVHFEDKLYLAPLTTVGNLPFRRICKRLGADITCGEMALSTNLLQGQLSEWALLKRHPSEDCFGIQICGSYPDTMTRCAQLLTETCDIDFIDINCGCPIDLIFKKGEGSALMGRSAKMEQIVRSMTSVMDIPLTLKMRTGIFEDKSIAHLLVPKLRDWGLSALTIHGRSREQRYTKLADWQYLEQCASLASPMPFFGNGDVLSYEDYNRCKAVPGMTGIMIARGSLIKPWLFTEIKEQRHWDISATERLDLLKDYVNFGLEHWGSDDQGVSTTRRFLLEWLSFLHRYIPVGILEHLPQKINEKPPHYFGRSDLETLLASPSYTDWIKISELLLGPVPEGFTFMPKHKANAYQ